MIFLLFLSALALSGIAAFYSIAGLMAIFATAPIPIAVMGSTLEVAKLVIASWLYRNWKPIPYLMKTYLTAALVVLMTLTSMGIFGYLSKAHLDQAVPTGDIAAQLSLIEEKIKTEKETIDVARNQILQLDSMVNQTLDRTANNATDDSGVKRSIAIRKSQRRDRAALSKEIETSQKAIAILNEERAPIAAKYRKVEAEVGPIKYIADLIYGSEASKDQNLLEKAVRWVIIMIVSVFDPLAVIMLIAANWTLVHTRKKREPEVPAPVVPAPESIVEVEIVKPKKPRVKKPKAQSKLPSQVEDPQGYVVIPKPFTPSKTIVQEVEDLQK